jgi:glycosyltransferase involved in cell wall biosynthesis
MNNRRMAFVHDALVYRGGAERVVACLLQRWAEVPVFTSAYLPDSTYERFRTARVVTSPLQRLAVSPHVVMRWVFPFMVPAFRSFDFGGYDVVLSSAAHAAKVIRVPPGTVHLCYCYTPLRLAWRPGDYLPPGANPARRVLIKSVAAMLRRWDYKVAQRVHHFATTCENVRRRIEACYGRRATVIPAPVDADHFHVRSSPEGYYLLVSRLNAYKRVDVAIQAFENLGLPLRIVGEGPARQSLQGMVTSDRVRFLGRVSDAELLRLYAGCEALVFPQEEDYGLTPLEAQASGRPVVAYAAGGALETVVDGETGVLFGSQTPDALADAVGRARRIPFDPHHIRAHARRFGVEPFCDRVQSFIDSCATAAAVRTSPGRHQPTVDVCLQDARDTGD